MAFTLKYAQIQATTLAGAGASIADTTLILTSFKSIDGVNLAMTDFGSIGYGTIEPNNGTKEEQISFTGVTQNANGTATLTGVKHVLFLTPYTATSGLTKAHAGGVTFVISNTSAFYQEIINYIDGIAIAGAPDMTTTTKGIGEEATASEINAGTQTGGTSAELVVNPKYLKDSIYYTQLPSSDEKAALAGSTPSGSNKYVTFADTAETGNSTIIKTKSTGLLDSSIIPTQIRTAGITTRGGGDADGTQTIAHGLGRTPVSVRFSAVFGYGSSATTSAVVMGSYTSSGNRCVGVFTTPSSPTYSDDWNSTSNALVLYYKAASVSSRTRQFGVVSVDATNITIVWTSGDPAGIGDYSIMWEAE